MPVTSRKLQVYQVSGAGKRGPTNLRWDNAKKTLINIECDCITIPIVVGIGLRTNIGDNTLLYSLDDGLTWNGLGDAIFDSYGTCAVWNGTLWVAGGLGTQNAVAYSYNGMNWTGVGLISTGPSSNTNFCSSIVWTGQNFVGVSNNVIIKSSDGINWIGLSGVTASQSLSKVSTNGSRIVALPSLPSMNIMYSDDEGNSWVGTPDSSGTLAAEGILNYTDILYDGSKFIITVSTRISPNNSKFYSSDGLTWTPIPNVNYTEGYNVGYMNSNSLYISRGVTPNSTEQSVNGINWVTISNPVLDAFPIASGGRNVIFSTQKYIIIAGCTSNNFIYSKDGSSWTLSSTGLAGRFMGGFSKKRFPS